jgi:hypothetical protein
VIAIMEMKVFSVTWPNRMTWPWLMQGVRSIELGAQQRRDVIEQRRYRFAVVSSFAPKEHDQDGERV